MTQSLNQFELSKEKGQLDLKLGQNIVQCKVSGNLIAGQAVTRVDIVNGIPVVIAAEDTDEVFGYVVYNLKETSYTDGKVCEVAMKGSIMFMIAGEAIAPMQELMHVAATGKMMIATGVTKVISAWAFDKAASADDIIRVYIEAPTFKKPVA